EAELTLLVPTAGSKGSGVSCGKTPPVLAAPVAGVGRGFSPVLPTRPNPPAGSVRSSNTSSLRLRGARRKRRWGRERDRQKRTSERQDILETSVGRPGAVNAPYE